VFWTIAPLIAAAVTYELLQSLNRFAALTRDDIPTQKQSHDRRPNLTSPLLL
jgi:hypothetical protein